MYTVNNSCKNCNLKKKKRKKASTKKRKRTFDYIAIKPNTENLTTTKKLKTSM